MFASKWLLAGLIVSVVLLGGCLEYLGPTCNSDDPTKLNVNAIQTSGGVSIKSLETITIKNRTDGRISDITCYGSGVFEETVADCPTTVLSEEKFDLKPDYKTSETEYSGTITINFIDQFGLSRKVIITCSRSPKQ